MHIVSKGKLMVFVPLTLIITFLVQLVYIGYITAHMLSNTAKYERVLKELKEESFRETQFNKNIINDIIQKNNILRVRITNLENDVEKLIQANRQEIKGIQNGS